MPIAWMSRVVRTAGFAAAVIGGATAGIAPAAEEPPPFPREFRAAWVATVANIDWPTRPGLSTAEQQREAIRILDAASRIKLNAIVLQVRPAADALYESRLEPWSAYLTGTQGKRPEPYYDPLRFWVDEAHRRGLQLHAWFNPYRARLNARFAESADHISKTRPDLVKRYGEMLWLDPGEPEAAERTLQVLLDVVRRYDVDGIHLDDYFYPYPIVDPASPGKKVELPFPDDPSWRKYQESGGKLDRDDWRRESVNRLIERIYAGIKKEKRAVLFGISPFGIPRPGLPKGVVGFDQYEKLYADTVLWLNRGWCDYFSPQLYWKIEAPGQPFRPLLKHWVGENTESRHIWPGLSVSRVGGGPKGYAPEEILGQVAIIRETPGASGHVLFSMKALLNGHRDIGERLATGPYRAPALIPASPWLGGQVPGLPQVEAAERDGKLALTVRHGPGAPPFLWAVSVRRGASWTHSVHPAQGGPLLIDGAGGEPASVVAVAAVDRPGNASERVLVPVSSPKAE